MRRLFSFHHLAALSILAPSAFCLPPILGADEPDLTPLKKWIEFQRGVDTVKADLVQDRKLKTLRHPMRSEGTLWIDQPDLFRWQMNGNPPRMIAIRDKKVITVLHPKKKEAEVVVAGSGAVPALDFLAEGFPDSVEALQKKFDVISSVEKDGEWQISLKPRDREAAKNLTGITFFIAADQFFLKGFQLDLSDGSNIRTYFAKQVFNESVDATLFVPDLEGYTVENK
jgi:outer membrane lipoprotein-sorting protein